MVVQQELLNGSGLNFFFKFDFTKKEENLLPQLLPYFAVVRDGAYRLHLTMIGKELYKILFPHADLRVV